MLTDNVPSDTVAKNEGYYSSTNGENAKRSDWARLKLFSDLTTVTHFIAFKTDVLGVQKMQAVIGLYHQVLKQSRTDVCNQLLVTKVIVCKL